MKRLLIPNRVQKLLNPTLLRLLRTQKGPQRRQILSRLGPKRARELLHDWRLWARKDQYWQPGEEKYTMYLAGRGWGKTRTGSGATNETAEYRAEDVGGEMALIGKTPRAVRADMIEGPAGIITHSKPWFRPKYYPSKRRLVWPNGVVCHVYSAHNPAELRGPQVGFVWADELPHWAYPEKSWDEGVELFLRHGRSPKGIITTTPLPIDLIVKLANDPDVRVVNGSTADNMGNLAADYIARTYARFKGTDLAQQELEGRILDTNRRALWTHNNIRRISSDERPSLFRIVVAVDPAGGSNEKKNDETGIVVAGIDERERLFVLCDASGVMAAHEWAQRAIHLAREWGASAIVAEANFGGDMVATTIQQHEDWNGDCELQIVHATKSKGARAQPVAAIYAQGRAFHVCDDQSDFARLEYQQTHFDPTLPRRQQKSPDRMDALVWAAISLLADGDDGQAMRVDHAGALESVFEELGMDTDASDDDLEWSMRLINMARRRPGLVPELLPELLAA